jgi:DNA-binding NtrC family response regulator
MSQAQVHPGASSPAMIFVVDDEPMLLDLAAAILEPLGYDVRTFSDPQAALAEYSKAKPAVVVTDFAMGAMSGMDLINECKRVNPAQKTMLVSGTVDENIFMNDSTRPDMFLAKPYQVGEFVKSVQDLAGS